MEKKCLNLEKMNNYKKNSIFDLSELISKKLFIILKEGETFSGTLKLFEKTENIFIIPEKQGESYFKGDLAKNTSVNIKFEKPVNIKVYGISNNVYIENAKNVHNKNIGQRVHNENIEGNVLNIGIGKNAINENIKGNVINFSIGRRTFNVNIAGYVENYELNKVYNFNIPYILNKNCQKSYNKLGKYIFNIGNTVSSNEKNYFVYNQNIYDKTTNDKIYIVINALSTGTILNKYVHYVINYKSILSKLQNIGIFNTVYNKDTTGPIENNGVGNFVICDNTKCKVVNKGTIGKFYSSKSILGFLKKKPFELVSFLEFLYKKINDKNVVEKIKKMMNL